MNSRLLFISDVVKGSEMRMEQGDGEWKMGVNK